MDPMYRQQMQIMATYGSTKSASTATTIGQAPPSTSNPNLNNAEVVTSTVAAAKSAPSISQTSSVVNPVPASIIVMPNANESKKSKEGAENASEEVFQSKNEETNSIPPSTEKSVTTKQAAPPPYLQDWGLSWYVKIIIGVSFLKKKGQGKLFKKNVFEKGASSKLWLNAIYDEIIAI